MNLDLSSLNENQRTAVDWQTGALLVLAGPGSGKTKVLTYRIAKILQETPRQYFAMLALTFTNKAAAEMRERLAALLPNLEERVKVTTFHGLAARILSQHGYHLGLRPDFTVLNLEEDQRAILKELMTDLEGYSPERVLMTIRTLLDSGILAEEAKAFLLKRQVPEEEADWLSRLYYDYGQTMIAANCLDFGSLITQTINLLTTKPAIHQFLHRIYRYVCIDEFQDTNRSQYRLLSLLVNPDTRNLFVVADDDQVIYQWNGANPARLKQLKDDFQATVLQLPENYRCPPEVIDLANKLIVHNSKRATDKQPLIAHRPSGTTPSVRVKSFSTFAEEAKWIASEIANHPKRPDCVVLARSKRLLEEIVKELQQLQVPAYLHSRKDEFTSTPLRWLHALLRLANARQARKPLHTICQTFHALEGIKIEPEDVVTLATTQEGDYLRAWQTMVLGRTGDLSEGAKRILDHSLPQLVDKLDFQSLVKKVFEWFDSLKNEESSAISQERFIDYEEEKQTWQDLEIEIAKSGRESVTLHLLLQEFDLRSKTPPPPRGAIPCFTVHAAKGMEFKQVYLAGLVEEQFPSWQAIKKGDHSDEMQEERRNCFVAITRTQETLTLTYSETVFGWSKQPSRFLKEMELLPENHLTL